MSPDKKPAPKARSKRPPATAVTRYDPDHPYRVVYFRRHKNDDPSESMPGREFLRSCPDKIRATMAAVLLQVAAAPPHRFAGGGYWEAMHGDMAGFHEVRVDGPRRHHYRLFCLLDTEALGDGPLLVVLAGADKPFQTTLSEATYAEVRRLGDEYRKRQPRSLG